MTDMTTEELAELLHRLFALHWGGLSGERSADWDDLTAEDRSLWTGMAEVVLPAVATAVRAEWRGQKAKVVTRWTPFDEVLIHIDGEWGERLAHVVVSWDDWVAMRAAIDAIREGGE